MADKFISPNYLNKFQSRFCNHQVKVIFSAGHFPQEEDAIAVAEAIRIFQCKLIEDNRAISVNENPVIEHELQ